MKERWDVIFDICSYITVFKLRQIRLCWGLGRLWGEHKDLCSLSCLKRYGSIILVWCYRCGNSPLPLLQLLFLVAQFSIVIEAQTQMGQQGRAGGLSAPSLTLKSSTVFSSWLVNWPEEDRHRSISGIYYPPMNGREKDMQIRRAKKRRKWKKIFEEILNISIKKQTSVP